MELCPKPMLPSGYYEVSQPDSPIVLPSHLTCTVYREVFVAKLLAVQRVTLVLHDAVVTAVLHCTIWWRLFCMCCITFSSHLFPILLFWTQQLPCWLPFVFQPVTTLIMSLFRAPSICKPRPSHTFSLVQLLCPVIGWTDVAYIPMPCNPLHFSWSTGLLRIKATGFFQHTRNCSPNNAASHPTRFNYLSWSHTIYNSIVETDGNVYLRHWLFEYGGISVYYLLFMISFVVYQNCFKIISLSSVVKITGIHAFHSWLKICKCVCQNEKHSFMEKRSPTHAGSSVVTVIFICHKLLF
jgi:hypothetical protein